MEFIFIFLIIVLLTLFNLKLFTTDRGFKSSLFSKLESLFSEWFSEQPSSIPLFCSSKGPSLQATLFQNHFKIRCLILYFLRKYLFVHRLNGHQLYTNVYAKYCHLRQNGIHFLHIFYLQLHSLDLSSYLA